MCGESVVKARIKLKFQDVSGNSIVVSRAMESTQKKNKITTKTLEGCIEKTDANTKEVILAHQCLHALRTFTRARVCSPNPSSHRWHRPGHQRQRQVR